MNIIELAQEAGFMLVTGDAFDENAWFECFPDQIERFAELVREDERKRLNGVTAHEQMLIDGQQSLLRGKK